MEISVDELDISQLHSGQEAIVSVDALGGEQFPATLTRISSTGENEGGNTKFAVELTLEKSGEMLPGMTASVQLSLESHPDSLCVPLRRCPSWAARVWSTPAMTREAER